MWFSLVLHCNTRCNNMFRSFKCDKIIVVLDCELAEMNAFIKTVKSVYVRWKTYFHVNRIGWNAINFTKSAAHFHDRHEIVWQLSYGLEIMRLTEWEMEKTTNKSTTMVVNWTFRYKIYNLKSTHTSNTIVAWSKKWFPENLSINSVSVRLGLHSIYSNAEDWTFMRAFQCCKHHTIIIVCDNYFHVNKAT